MALWEVNNGIKQVVMYSEGALSIKNPPSYLSVRRKFYTVPYSNVGKGGIIRSNGVTYHVPSWTKVHEQTTLDDIIIEQRPFDELFTSPDTSNDGYEPRQFTSTSSDKIYTVKRGKNGFYCDCWGYIAHKKCKHVKQVQEEWDT